jgi:hypothetical protein
MEVELSWLEGRRPLSSTRAIYGKGDKASSARKDALERLKRLEPEPERTAPYAERCAKCGGAVKTIKLLPEVYDLKKNGTNVKVKDETLKITCECGHIWYSRPLDQKS